VTLPKRLLTAVPLVLIVLLAGCGGDADGETPETEAGNSQGEEGGESDLVQAATEQFEALLEDEAGVYFALLSRECREELGMAAVEGNLVDRRSRASTDGVDLSALSVAEVSIEGGGSEATVSLDIAGPGGAQFRETLPHRWVFEEGGWHMDDCSDFRESQGGLAGVGMDRDDPMALGGVGDVNGWLVSLTYVDTDAEDFVVEFGGRPASEGSQYVSVQVGFNYNGAEPSITVGDELEFAMVSGETVYGGESACETTETGVYFDPTVTLTPGESTANPSVCRQVASEDVTSLLLRVTHIPTGDQWWWRLDG
jgi:hypothetical protein